MSATAHHMRALVFDAPAPDTSESHIREVPLPSPGPGQVAIDVSHAGVNFKDVMARRGDPGYVPDWPFVPGLEVAGTVRALGDGVTGVAVGDRVAAYTGEGGLADVALASAELTVPRPDGLDPRLAAVACGSYVTAGLLVGAMGRLRTGDTVLVHSAAGGVGQAVAAVARLAGARLVLGTVGSDSRRRSAEGAGYDQVFLRGPDLARQVLAATAGQGVDLVLDPQGTAQLEVDLRVTAPAGKVVIFGNAGGAMFEALPPVTRLLAGNASITGFSLAALTVTRPRLVAEALSTAIGHLAAGDLRLNPATVDGLAGAPAAQQALAEGRGRGKQVVALA